jgi:peroxiredoxin
LAEYRDLYDRIRGAGADLAAVAVDQPRSSAAIRNELKLPYMILCDTKRTLVRSWGVFNEKEKGGIAETSVFVVDRGGIVRLASVDTMTSRVPAATVLKFLESGMPDSDASPARKNLKLHLGTLARAIRNVIRFKIRSPQN